MAGNRKVQLVLELGIAGTHYVPTFEITGGTRANIEKEDSSPGSGEP